LQKNIKDNSLNKVYLFNIALSDKKEEISFYVDKNNPGWLTMSTIKSRMPKDKILTQAQPLSDFIKEKTIDFLAMDIEGSEGKVFAELEKTNKIKKIKKMIVEYHLNIENKSKLSELLRIIEKNKFTYCLSGSFGLLNKENTYQDILIYAQQLY
jgi:FkbM family methyltransferase